MLKVQKTKTLLMGETLMLGHPTCFLRKLSKNREKKKVLSCDWELRSGTDAESSSQ